MSLKPYFEEDGITIYHGDCREVLQELSYGLVMTDPPYGQAYSSNWKSPWTGTEILSDRDVDVRDYVIHMMLGHPMFVFGTWKAPRPRFMKHLLIWDKGPARGMGDLSFPWKNSFEEIYVLGEGFGHERRDEGVIKNCWDYSTIAGPALDGNGRQHPNEKPIALLAYLLARHKGNPVLDPFMGSGTTLRAAKDLGRRAIGIEIEEKYCEIAAKRLSQKVFQFP